MVLTPKHLLEGRVCCKREIWLARSRRLRWAVDDQLSACGLVWEGIETLRIDMMIAMALL